MIDFRNGLIFKLVESNTYPAEIQPFLIQGEQVLSSYKAVRDSVTFTNKRIIALNVQGITGKKKDFTSIPYSKIQTFSVETAGTLDVDCELEIWVSGLGSVKFEFDGDCDITWIGQAISNAIL